MFCLLSWIRATPCERGVRARSQSSRADSTKVEAAISCGPNEPAGACLLWSQRCILAPRVRPDGSRTKNGLLRTKSRAYVFLARFRISVARTRECPEGRCIARFSSSAHRRLLDVAPHYMRIDATPLRFRRGPRCLLELSLVDFERFYPRL